MLVQDFHRSPKCSKNTWRKLGYPGNSSTLFRWYHDYLDRGYVRKPRKWGEKFTDEQKRIAVEYYLSNGKNALITVRDLEYPSRTLLMLWIDELAPGMRKRTKSHRRYSDDERIEVVADVYVNTTSIKKTIMESDIDKVTFYNWRNKFLGNDAQKVVEDLKERELPDDVEKLQEMIEAQKEELRRLKLEAAVWRGAAEFVKKEPGADPMNPTNREKMILIGALKSEFSLKELLEATGLSKSSYYYQMHVMDIPDKYAELRKTITGIFRASKKTWGYRRIWAALRQADKPVVVSEKVVRSIMVQGGLKVIYHAKKRHWSSYGGEKTPAPSNLVKRDFHASLPNFLWLTDITQFALADFKCHLSPIIDYFDGKVASWTASQSPDAEFVNTMLDDAAAALSPGEHPILHSDRGVHYRWPGWIKRCDAAGIIRSMSKKGCSPDNSTCEGFFGRLKNEFFYYRDWKGVTFDKFVAELGAYIDYYNEKRIKQSLGWMSPMQYRRGLGLAA